MSTYQDFFTQVLTRIGAPSTDTNLNALYAVSTYEGIQGTGDNGPQRYNPLNSVVPYGDSTSYNSVNVQDYKTFQNGVDGTVALLNGSPWVGVVSALRNNLGTEAVLIQFANVYHGWSPDTTADSFPANPGLGTVTMGPADGGSTPNNPPPSTGNPPEQGHTYTVQEGDTLWSIAAKAYGTGTLFGAIAAANHIVAPYVIHVGETLVIPTEHPDTHPVAPKPGVVKKVYTVKEGDTLWGIAQLFYGNGALYTKIAAANHVANPDLIHPGQTLVIPV